MKINSRSILTGIVLVVILAGIVLFIRRSKPALVVQPKLPAGTTVYRAALKVYGPANAPVKLTEYSDFECPSCRVVQTDLQNLFRNYPGKIQLTFKHFPLTSHKWSIYAHQAAECMNAQGKFWPLHDMIYAKQQEWTPSQTPPVELFMKYAREIGANMNHFAACLSDVAVTREIYTEKEGGNQQQVTATPTFFLGTERFVGPKEMQERGENAVRKVLGLPPKPAPPPKPEPLAPPPLKGSVQ